jgi:hypothetical protein
MQMGTGACLLVAAGRAFADSSAQRAGGIVATAWGAAVIQFWKEHQHILGVGLALGWLVFALARPPRLRRTRSLTATRSSVR